MAQAYLSEGMNDVASFDLYFRELPPNRNFMIACGLEPALEWVEGWGFSEQEVAYLDGLELFDDDFLEMLSTISFSGEVMAMPEGTAVFGNEPLISVTAPMIEAQLLETSLLNAFVHPTLVASKAARIALVCGDRAFVDFGARRTHGRDAALMAARSSVVGGARATSNVEAGMAFGLEVSGTMAHSYVLAFPDELSAFLAFARRFPEAPVLLIDTFDTVEGARVAVRAARELRESGIEVRAVRLDSGDLATLSASVRGVLDEAKLQDVQIFASGDLDEYRIAELVGDGAPIDAFGVGTRLGTSIDAPALGAVYKLVEDSSGPKAKESTGKETFGGRKQVWRSFSDGRMTGDIVAPLEHQDTEATALLSKVMEGGRRIRPSPAVSELQDRTEQTLESLPSSLRSLDSSAAYPVELQDALVKP